MNLTIAIEPDDIDATRFMVVIREVNEYRTIIGVPVRGITRKLAEQFLAPCKYAFVYGLDFKSQHIKKFLSSGDSWITWKEH